MSIDVLDTKVLAALRNNPHCSGRRLRIETEADRVVLHGIVGSYYQKQMAQEALRGVDGVREIENRLIVEWGASAGDYASSI